jgi:hypothetical protein
MEDGRLARPEASGRKHLFSGELSFLLELFIVSKNPARLL